MRARAFDLALALACCIAVAPGLTAPLTRYDDAMYITGNTELLSRPGLAGLALVWDGSRAWSADFLEFFPLRDSVYWLVCQFFGLAPAAYHVVSLCFHITATLLALRLALAVGFGRWEAGLIAFIFAAHPVHTESVLWAAGLKDPMYTAFVLGSLWAYLRYRDRLRPVWYLLALVLMVGGFLVKAMAVTTPLLMAATELWVGRRSSWRVALSRLAGPTLIAALFLAQFVAIGSMNSMLVKPHGGSWPGHVVLAAWAQVLYLKQVLAPGGFQLIYCFDPPTGLLDGRLFAAGVVLAAVVALGWRWRSHPLRMFAMAWYVVCMLPTANILPIPPVMDDRFLYAAMFGAGGLIASLLMALAEPLRWLVASTAVLVLLGTSTIQSTSWREEENLWVDPDEDPACMTDPSFLATNAHLLHYWSQSDRRAALEALDRAVRSKDPTESGLSCAVRARGLIEAVQFARFDLADRWASPLAESCPHEAETWNALMALSIHRRPPAAAAAAQRAWRLSPTPRTAALLAITAAEAGDPDARQWALRAVEAAPQEACPPLVQWVSEVSLQQSEVLVEAFFACGAFTPMCQEGFGIP